MDIVISYMPSIIDGTWITVALAAASLLLSCLLGLLGAWAKLSASKLARGVGKQVHPEPVLVDKSLMATA